MGGTSPNCRSRAHRQAPVGAPAFLPRRKDGHTHATRSASEKQSTPFSKGSALHSAPLCVSQVEGRPLPLGEFRARAPGTGGWEEGGKGLERRRKRAAATAGRKESWEQERPSTRLPRSRGRKDAPFAAHSREAEPQLGGGGGGGMVETPQQPDRRGNKEGRRFLSPTPSPRSCCPCTTEPRQGSLGRLMHLFPWQSKAALGKMLPLFQMLSNPSSAFQGLPQPCRLHCKPGGLMPVLPSRGGSLQPPRTTAAGRGVATAPGLPFYCGTNILAKLK